VRRPIGLDDVEGYARGKAWIEEDMSDHVPDRALRTDP